MINNPQLTINRQLILVVPKQAALEWLLRVDPNPIENLALDEIRQEQDAYLLPLGMVTTYEQAQQWAEDRWPQLFIHFLGSWFLNEDLWPKRRTQKMFNEWFEIQYHSIVWDLCEMPITHERWDKYFV